nr:hypothetical protein [Chloroflexota bacterium]
MHYLSVTPPDVTASTIIRAAVGAASLPRLLFGRRRSTQTHDGDAPIVVGFIEDGDRFFIIDPPLTLTPRRATDGLLYVMDEHLDVLARGATRDALVQALHREFPLVWDTYVTATVTRRDDGNRVAQALR